MGNPNGMRGGGGSAAAIAHGIGSGVSEGGIAGMQKLSEAEFHALGEYLGGKSNTMNTLLRTGTHTQTDIISRKDLKALIEKVDTAIAKGTLTTSQTLYRATSLNKMGLTSAPKVGEVIRDRAFLSTSRGSFDAKFTGNVRLTISAPKGTHAADVSHVVGGAERETLFSRGTRLRVTSVRTGADGVHHVSAEIVK